MTTANQISGYTYDSAGNLDTIPGTGGITFTYNGENELTTSSAGVTYTYDGDGKRVEKSSGTVYWYASASLSAGGAGTEILDESNTSGTISNEYVFFGGKRVAMRNVTSGTIYYYEEDMLGSSRTMVQAGQTAVCYDADFYPFGGERDITNTCTQHYKFEGKERDTETGNDDFGARYYTSRLGRWLSADWSAAPAPVPYANLTNPQTLNLYAMVSDNPETFADLDGHTCTFGPSGGDVCKPDVATSPAATTGGNDPASNTSGDGQTKSQSQTAAELAAQVPQEVKTAIAASVKASNSQTADDKYGGHHEESGQWGTDASGKTVVSPSKPGPYAPPGVDPHTNMNNPVNPKLNEEFASFGGQWHVHPGGVSLDGNGNAHYYVQPPSPGDKHNTVPGMNIVVGAGDKTVYFYNNSGVIAHMSLKNFMRSPQ